VVRQGVNGFEHVNIVTQDFFSNTVYYDLVKGFFDGAQMPSKYDNADSCRIAFSAMMDDFYFMNINHTTSLNWEERFFNVTGVLSLNYAETMYQCFVMLQQIQEVAVVQQESFVDQNDFVTSFLFNLLAQSIVVRQYSYNLITYSESEDWESYVRTLGAILAALIYFDSTASPFNPIEDPYSPYYINSEGNLTLTESNYSFYKLDDISYGFTIGNTENLDDLAKERLRVREDEVAYNFTGNSTIQLIFGGIDGALNALPVGDNLYYCGLNSEE
jgi:hypothetical protein